MSAKIATPGLLKIKLFGNNGCNVTISVDDVTNKILSRDSNDRYKLKILHQCGKSVKTSSQI